MSKKSKAIDFFEKVESDISSMRWELQRAEQFGQAMKIYREEGNLTKVTEMEWDSILYKLRYLQNQDERKKTNSRFAEMIKYKNGSVFPDMSTFNEDQIEYYKNRANKTLNPIHKARYNEIVWELRKEYKFAQNAIYAYLECIPIYYDNNWEMELADSIVRAVELSLILNDQNALETVRKELVKRIIILSDNEKFRWCLDLIDGILKIKRFLKENELETCVTIAKSAVSFYKKVRDGYHLQRSFLEKLVTLANELKKPDEALKYLEDIAESYVAEADWKLTNYPSGNMVAAYFYELAARMYRDLGLLNKSNFFIKKVKEHTKESEKEMKEIKVEFVIPNEPIKKYIQSLNPLNLNEALDKISTETSFLPNLAKIRSEIEQQKGKLIGLVIPRVSIRNGNPSLRSQTYEEIFEDHVISNFSMDYKMRKIVIGQIFEELIKAKKLDEKSFLSYLLSSKIYDSNSKKLMEIGFERYFSGDYISCLHILTPQLERTFRNILDKLDLPTTSIRGNSIEEKTLGNILEEPKIIELLGEDISTYTSTLLVDKRGDNLRNDIAHGLISEKACNIGTANNILHLFLLLSKIKLDKK